MLALVVALAIPAAGLAALATIAMTLRAQLPAVRRLFADARTLRQDREFLAVLVATPQPVCGPLPAPIAPSPMAQAAVAARGGARSAVRSVRPLWPAHLRAAA